MSEPFLGQIMLTSFNYPPQGWALCNGQTLPINQNQALFSLLGTNYGGDGVTTFRLPNLQGMVPLHMGGGFNLGQTGGEASHTLTVPEMPGHTHPLQGISAPATSQNPTGNYLASVSNVDDPCYVTSAPNAALNPLSIQNAGGAGHENRQPYLVLSFCIALAGIYPSQN